MNGDAARINNWLRPCFQAKGLWMDVLELLGDVPY